MTHANPIPSAIQDAHALVKQSGVCADVGELTAHGPSLFSFTCTFALPHPNVAELPENITLSAYFSDAFPYKPIEFVPTNKDEGLSGFPHQGADSGKLCLPAEQKAPCNIQRLLVYVGWARDWLLDAANNTLLKSGEPFELPDFRLKNVKSTPPTELNVFTDESTHTFGAWQGRIGQTGIVELHRLTRPRGLFAARFLTEDSKLIRRSSFDLAHGRSTTLSTRWLLLPSLIVHRHRAARQYQELFDLCVASSISLKALLKKAWVAGSKSHPYSVLMLGFPVPAKVGEQPVEIHWQSLLLPNKDATKRTVSWKKGKRDQGRLWNHALNEGPFSKRKPLFWGTTENLSRERQYARGSLSPAVCGKHIAVMGCGALGSVVAEGLCRGGVKQMSFFDEQTLEYGNLCRHTLDGRDVDRTKAAALADRLRSTNMTSRITAHSLHVPWAGYEHGAFNAQQALDDVHVLLDCTTDHSAFLWMSEFAKHRRKRLASLFINPHATLLTLVLSGKQTSAKKVFQSLMASIEQGATTVNPDEYFADLSTEDAILPGAGCWHATFPALNSHIWSLACAALEQIVAWIDENERCDGFGVVVRRNSEGRVGPTIETIWKQPYR